MIEEISISILQESKLSEPYVSENALKVLKNRYLKKDKNDNTIESPKQMYMRVAEAAASVEKEEIRSIWAENFYNIMASNTMMPNSPTLMNAGNKEGKQMCSACFVLEVDDTMESIMQTMKDTAMTQKLGGGTGFSFSKLRPSGSFISGSGGTTSGPLSFIDAYSATTTAIQQGAYRRGANMAILAINHPDIISFIIAKSDLKRWQNYNVSVSVTEAFMSMLKEKPESHHLVYHDKWGTGGLWVDTEHDEIIAVRNTEVTRELKISHRKWTIQNTWDLICERAWTTGEPGLLFIDEVNKNNPIEASLGKIEATNPCFHPDTLIETTEGQIKISDIKKPVKVYSMDQHGKLIISQASSSFLTKKKAQTLTVNIESGKSITVTPDHKIFIVGKGWTEASNIKKGDFVSHLCRARRGVAYSGVKLSTEDNRAYQMEHRLVYEAHYGAIRDDYDIHHVNGNTYDNCINNLQKLTHEMHSRYTAINDNPQNHQITNSKGKFIYNGGTKLKKAIKMLSHLKSFLKSQYSCRVKSIVEGPITDVYDIKVENSHCLIANMIVAHNCGEEPMHSGDSCTLGAINLGKFYRPGFEGPIQDFDTDQFALAIETTTRFLDNILAINDYPIEQMKKISELTRRIGVGIMGFADLLFKLDIPYNSDEAVEISKNLSAFLKEETVITSESLAEEKGPFELYKNSTFKKPRRNAFINTIAPTGTISIIADCSGGCEPKFALSITRKVMKDSDGVPLVMTEFDEQFKNSLFDLTIEESQKIAIIKHVETFGNLSKYNYEGKFEDNYQSFKEIFVTSQEISPFEHIDIQAAWQINIDAGISKTINLNKDAIVKDIKDAYLYAYKNKCKGVTVYRDGCRDNAEGMTQPMNVGKDKEEHVKLAPATFDPEFANAKRLRVSTQWGNVHLVIVSDDNGKEMEIFAQLGKAGDLITADIEGLCRIASLYLRDGGTIEEVIKQWEDIGSSHATMPGPHGRITSLPDALAKGLKLYQSNSELIIKTSARKDALDTAYGVKCPQCTVSNLVFQEGCKKCLGCGYSMC